MKYIKKELEPIEFSAWKALENEDWQPFYSEMPSDIKIIVKNALIDEQGYICCYCERRLVDCNHHIEHFRPQSDSSIQSLDYGNMLCSCQNQMEKGEPRHCGNRKGGWFDEELLISPLDSGCESRFLFSGKGEIMPASSRDNTAIETIDRLGLNIPKLRALRKSALAPFLDIELNDDEFRRFVSGYLQKDDNGYYGEFWTTIRCIFGECAIL